MMMALSLVAQGQTNAEANMDVDAINALVANAARNSPSEAFDLAQKNDKDKQHFSIFIPVPWPMSGKPARAHLLLRYNSANSSAAPEIL
jgi:hypothetical protein